MRLSDEVSSSPGGIVHAASLHGELALTDRDRTPIPLVHDWPAVRSTHALTRSTSFSVADRPQVRSLNGPGRDSAPESDLPRSRRPHEARGDGWRTHQRLRPRSFVHDPFAPSLMAFHAAFTCASSVRRCGRLASHRSARRGRVAPETAAHWRAMPASWSSAQERRRGAEEPDQESLPGGAAERPGGGHRRVVKTGRETLEDPRSYSPWQCRFSARCASLNLFD